MGILSKLLGVPSKKTLFEMMSNGAVLLESGARSAQAVRFVKKMGYKAYNGGSWSKFKYLDAE